MNSFVRKGIIVRVRRCRFSGEQFFSEEIYWVYHGVVRTYIICRFAGETFFRKKFIVRLWRCEIHSSSTGFHVKRILGRNLL